VRVKAELLAWLLERENPSARYLTLTKVLGRALGDPDVAAARAAIPDANPARAILDAQFAGSGYWIKPDVGYSPKYRATVWQVIFLAQLGAPPIEAIRRACDYVLDHSRRLTDRRDNLDGRFVAGKAARTAVNCLNGNLLWALAALGHGDDPRTVEAREATARAILKRGFACHYNGNLPCAWGAVKALRAFLELPSGERSTAVATAIKQGVELLLGVPLLKATYPTSSHTSDRWFKLGFPLAYRSDVLEAMTILAQSGHARHPHVQACVEWLLSKQDTSGRWALEQVPGKTWSSFGQVGQPNKWVTLRALGPLLAVGALQA
jgi:hypothetical protein